MKIRLAPVFAISHLMPYVYFTFVHKPISNHPPTALTIVEGEKVGADGGKKLPNVLPNGHPNAPIFGYTVFSVGSRLCQTVGGKRIAQSLSLPRLRGRSVREANEEGVHFPRAA